MERTSFRTEQFLRLQGHVRYAYESSPFYKSLYDAAGFRPAELRAWSDLARIPFTKKETLLADQEPNPPFGTQLCVGMDRVTRIFTSAGNLYSAFTPTDLASINESVAGHYRVLGVRPGDVADVAVAYHWVLAGIVSDEALTSVGAAVIPGGPGQSDQRLRIMKDCGVTVLQAFTPYAESLGMELRARGMDPRRDLKVRLVIVGGEMRSSGAKQRLSELWGGAAIREMYGTSETGGLVAVECLEVGDGMHIGDGCLLEVIDPDTGEPRDPATGGEIVLTELLREAQVIIRFRTGDITEGVDSSPCPCGRLMPRLRRIVGRRSDILRVKGLFVQPKLVAAVCEDNGCKGRYQIIVERPGTFDQMRVVVESHDQEIELRDRIVRHLKGTIGITCDVDLVLPGTIDSSAPTVSDRRVFSEK